MLTGSKIADAVRTAIPLAATTMRPDALAALRIAATHERSPRGLAVLEQLIANTEVAASAQMPLCQDTGTVWVRVEIGAEECVCGDVQAAVDGAVADAFRAARLRMSLVRDALFDRSNTADNTPAFIDIAFGARAGTGATVHVMLKGGGSDNASRVEMLPPGAGIDGVKRVVLESVAAKATGACPPLLVGVGVGATFDKVGGLAKKALLRAIGSENVDPDAAEFEAELLAGINATGIGPGGLGGDTTALAVHVVTAPCHIATLPVAVNLGCCAMRSVTVEVLP